MGDFLSLVEGLKNCQLLLVELELGSSGSHVHELIIHLPPYIAIKIMIWSYIVIKIFLFFGSAAGFI